MFMTDVFAKKKYGNKIKVLRGAFMETYNRLQELVEEYKNIKANTLDDGTYWTYDKVIRDLEEILYE